MTDHEFPTKTCTKCGRLKKLPDAFGFAAKGNNLYKSWCKECEALAARKKSGPPRTARGAMRKYS